VHRPLTESQQPVVQLDEVQTHCWLTHVSPDAQAGPLPHWQALFSQ